MKKIVAWAVIVMVGVLTVGCLTFESKEYSWKINADGSGNGKIVWRNFYSNGNEEEDASGEDFVSLINDYLEGQSLDDEKDAFKNVKKRLFVEGGVICGEMTFEFGNYTDAGFYRYKNDGPYMFMLAMSDESYFKSNGDWGGDDFQVIFWPGNTKEITLVTSLGDPDEDGAVNLMDYYNDWVKDGTLPETEDYDDTDDDPASKIRDAVDY